MQAQSIVVNSILLLFSISISVRADTPANCTYEDIRGVWIFQESDQIETRKENCDNFPASTNKVYISLDYPNVVLDKFGNVGHWTIIYNQGFEVTINYRKYFGFSLYQKNGSDVISYCNATAVGWSHDLLGNNWACFKGHKIDSWDQPKQVQLHPSLSGSGKVHTLKPFFFENVNMHNFLGDNFVHKLNFKQSSWTAKTYPFLQSKTTDELIRMTGGRNSRLVQ